MAACRLPLGGRSRARSPKNWVVWEGLAMEVRPGPAADSCRSRGLGAR